MLDNKNSTDKMNISTLQGGVPERLIGAVLKTVERSRVPWVRIPPPPPFKPPAKGGFFSGFWAYKHYRKYTQNILLGDYVGTEEFSNNLSNINFLFIFSDFTKGYLII